MYSIPKRVALLTAQPFGGGGVWSVTQYLWRMLEEDPRYQPELIVLATSSRDIASARLTAPWTLLSGPQIISANHRGFDCKHAGAWFVEVEHQRYRPRKNLSALLNQYDLIQIVAGTPAWAAVTGDIRKPVCLFTATTVEEERKAFLRSISGWRKVYYGQMTRINASIERATLPTLDAVFAESKYTQQTLSTLVRPERLFLAPPGVDTSFFSPAGKAVHTSGGYILSVGRFSDERKNVRLLIEAYTLLRNSTPYTPRLVLAGHTGPSNSDWALAEELGVADFIDVRIDLSLEQLRQIYQEASFFVLSSDEEGLGIVILEAMASGLAVISTDCGGPATAVVPEQTGFLSPVGNSESLAAYMKRLVETPTECRAFGEAGRTRAVEYFSLAATRQTYLNVYARLLEAR